jgi:hypothetical protein
MRTMLSIALACGVFFAAPAAAQPVTHPDGCGVTIALSPADARAVIEEWIRAEPACGIPLEVRVVPTDGGLYVQARDDRGGIRERVVPDAQSAGVLVASWMAAAALRPPGASPNAPATTLPSAPPPEPQATQIDVNVDYVRVEDDDEPWAPVRPPRSLALVMFSNTSGATTTGLRGELDVFTFGKWTLGAAASIQRSRIIDAYDADLLMGVSGGLMAWEYRMSGRLVRTFEFGMWRLRAGIGVGLLRTVPDVPTTIAQVYPYGEATIDAAFDMSRRTAFVLGAIASFADQHFMATGNGGVLLPVERGAPDLALLVGLRYRL